MDKRRVVFQIKITYQTEAETLNRIPQILKSIVLEQKDITFDRAHFASFGESSLTFEVVYFVLSSDFNKYMDIQQAINIRIFETLQDMGVEFAYPTRSVFLMNNPDQKKESIQKADQQILITSSDKI
jgi:small-conductance mechanosensitive channel